MMANTEVASSLSAGGRISPSMRAAQRASTTPSGGSMLLAGGGPPTRSHFEMVAGW
jgi:hypothetical protein